MDWRSGPACAETSETKAGLKLHSQPGQVTSHRRRRNSHGLETVPALTGSRDLRRDQLHCGRGQAISCGPFHWHSWKHSVLVPWGCRNEVPQTRWLIKHRHLCLTVLETRCPRSGCRRRWGPLMAPSCVLTWGKTEPALWPLVGALVPTWVHP